MRNCNVKKDLGQDSICKVVMCLQQWLPVFWIKDLF